MKHFSDETWADYVRGICNPETNADIGSHLSNRCSECVASFGTWQGVRSITANELTYSPPEDLVRLVKSEFAAKRAFEPAPWSLAKLVFDTLGQPLPAGVRASGVTARQLVYEAEGLTVDLRLDKQPSSKRISAVGQVLDKRIPRASGRAAVVLWTEKGHPILETKTNEHGEFELEFEAQDQLRISVELSGRTPVRIPLANLM